MLEGPIADAKKVYYGFDKLVSWAIVSLWRRLIVYLSVNILLLASVSYVLNNLNDEALKQSHKYQQSLTYQTELNGYKLVLDVINICIKDEENDYRLHKKHCDIATQMYEVNVKSKRPKPKIEANIKNRDYQFMAVDFNSFIRAAESKKIMNNRDTESENLLTKLTSNNAFFFLIVFIFFIFFGLLFIFERAAKRISELNSTDI